ncbi:zinc-dependent metalloprotease [Raineyella sp. LH-20]|uniref:zinc-dependent metalloprotease n=1 Tax=Raineyella sp. LH-20 TaxID=3081204 RepID=UPI0029559126|nr:zinc-dependent metalloprotease [Raineyella sp. LH-20]WOP17885.1 zinc-dependent metalloprotease [Raineyella sp. LH-20]
MADDPRRDDNDPDEGKPENDFEELLRRLGLPGAGPGGTPDLAAMMQQLQQAFGQMFAAGAPGPTAGYAGFVNPAGAGAPVQPGQVDWRQVSTIARRVCAERGEDPSPSREQRESLAEATRIADGWLDRSTSFPATERAPKVWSRAEWITSTLPVWQRIIAPVATSFADALADALLSAGPGEEQPAELAQMAGLLQPMLRTSGAMMYGQKVAEALGRLASEVLGLTDIGLPLGDDGAVVLVPTNVTEFSEGLDQSPTDIQVYLALREAAHQRLFAAAGWLRPQLLSLFEQYAAGIRIDMSAMEDMYRDLDPSSMDLGALQVAFEKLQGSLFEPVRTPEQQAVLERLETLLALIEGWVDDTVTQATGRWMPTAPALAETLRRRRATGGPAEEALNTVVGLELRPRRMRDAANLWAALREARGTEGRDALWTHPDHLPTAAGLDDPLGFVAGEVDQHGGEPEPAPEAYDLDAELERLLSEADRDRGTDADPDQDGH